MFIALTGRRRFITRGEAVDLPHYERTEDTCTPGDSQTGQSPLNTTPPTPPSSRQPPQTPPSGKTRRRIERSPGSLSPSAAATRRRFSPSGSPSTQSRATSLSTPSSQYSVQGDMNRYGSYGKDVALGRSMTGEGVSTSHRHYPSYLDSKLAELDPTRSSSYRTSRRDSSSSESSIHGSLASLHSDGSLRESTPSHHESLMTPPRSPVDKQKSRSPNNRPRSWYDAQQLQSLGHMSSESPTGFPFTASSYENLDREGSAEKVLPRSSTVASLGTTKKDNLSHLVHARSFAGHEGRDSISPKPTLGSSPFMVAKHFPGGKSVSWQPPSSRTGESGAARAKFTSDSNVRRFFPEGAALQSHGSRESPITRMASAESDGSSVTSVPAVSSTRTFGVDSPEVAMGTRRPVWDKVTRDGSFDSTISEPVILTRQSSQQEGEYIQHAPCKARPFGNRSQTVELSQIHQSRQGLSQLTKDKTRQKPASLSPSSVKEQAKKFDMRPDVVCPPCGVPVMPSGGKVSAEIAHYPVASYKSATMPAKLFDMNDRDRRPSLPEQGDRSVLYKEQRLKELSALPSSTTGLPKRSQSIDTTGKKISLFRSEAPSIGQEEMLMPSGAGRTKLVMSPQPSVTSPIPAVIPKPGSLPSEAAKSAINVLKPSVLTAAVEPSLSSSILQSKDSTLASSSNLDERTKALDAVSAQPLSPPPTLLTSRSSSPETASVDIAQLSDDVSSSSKAITADSDHSAFKPFRKSNEQQHLSASCSPAVSGTLSPTDTIQSPMKDKQSTSSTCKSPLLSVKSPTHSSLTSTSHSSRGSASTSPRLSPRPLELWTTKQSSPIREYHDPTAEENRKLEMKRGISQESIQSAMAVLDDAIAMLNSVAMDKSTGVITTAVTTAAVSTTATDTGIDLSRSGLLKYSSQVTGHKSLVTGHFASMPMPLRMGSGSSEIPFSAASTALVSSATEHTFGKSKNDLYKAMTELASSVQTVMTTSQSVSTGTTETTVVSSVLMSLPSAAAVTRLSPIDSTRREENNGKPSGAISVTNHNLAADIQVTDQPMVHADTSPLDQILASIQQEESKLCASAAKLEQPESSIKQTKKKHETPPRFKDRPLDRDKPLEEIEARRKMLIREDSFNRSDSEPDISCMPLPRDSVILRHRYHIKEDSSSSSDSSSPATPRLSPRVLRRHRKPGSDTSTVGDGKKRKHLNIPGKHKPGKDLSGSDRPLITSDGQSVNLQPNLVTTHGQPRDVSTSTGTYYSVPSTTHPPSSSPPSSHSAAVPPSSEVTWSTPPSTPQMPRLAMGVPQGRGSSSEVTRSGRPFEPIGREEGVYNVHAAAIGRPGSVGIQSDSSSVSSHRRRFRVREHDATEDSVAVVSVRPGRKDKSLQRKSALNLPGPDGLDHRRKDSDPSSSSSGTRHTSLSPTRRHYQATTTTATATATTIGSATATKHAPKGGLFSLGKTSKKEPKPSALGTLISQTAMLAPAVAQSHVVSDKQDVSKVLPSGAGLCSPSLPAKDKESAAVAEPQTTPPLDSTTKVKAVTPVFGMSRDIPESVSQEQASFMSPDQTSGSEPAMSEPYLSSRSFSPPTGSPPVPLSGGTTSPPQGVPLMGRQMLSKLPSQGSAAIDQVVPVSKSSLFPSSGSRLSCQAPDASTLSAPALPQPVVTMVTQPGIRAVSASSSVAVASTAPVVTRAMSQMPTASTAVAPSLSGFPTSGLPLSGLPLSKPKDTMAKPIASPKLVKTTRLKPLSEAVPGLQPLTAKVVSDQPSVQQEQQEQQLSVVPATSGVLIYQGTKHVTKQAGAQQQSQIPFISQQQHQEVETVRMTSEQKDSLQKQQDLQQQGSELTKSVEKSPWPLEKKPVQPHSQQQQQQQQQKQDEAKLDAKDKTLVMTQKPKYEKQESVETQKQQQQQQQQQQQKPTEKEQKTVDINKTKEIKPSLETSKLVAQQQTVKPATQQKNASPAVQHEASKPASTQQKTPGQQPKQKAVIAKTSVLKQKAVVSEVRPFAIAKAESPPLTLKADEPQKDKAELKPERKMEKSLERQESKGKRTPDCLSSVERKAVKEGTGLAEVSKNIQKEEVCSLSKMEPLYGSSLKRSASAPSHRHGVLRAHVTTPEIIETKLVSLSAVAEVPKPIREGDLEGSQSEKDADFQTPPITPFISGDDLTEKESVVEKGEKEGTELSCKDLAKSDQSDAIVIQAEGKIDRSEPSVDTSAIKLDQSERTTILQGNATDESEPDVVQSETNTDQSQLASIVAKAKSDQSEKPTSLQPDMRADEETTSEQQLLAVAAKEPTEQSASEIDNSKKGVSDGADTSSAEDDNDEDEGIIAMSAPVTDKIAAWQKHLTQHPQSSASQAHRQAILRERRGLGIWSSGDSVTEQVSVLTPITEEQKPEKADSRVEVSENSAEEGEDKVSVAQRIFQMENKLDEDRFTLTRPTSGFTTPRLKVIRPKGSPLKGAYTPHIQAIQPTSPLATDERQLLDKLTRVADIAMVRDAAAERRKRFLQRHSGDRRRTQPVTLDEIREADSLESVSSFRAEVLRKSSLNIFGQELEGSKEPFFVKKVKGQEVFPQHVKHERLKERHKDSVRFKTLPVTQTELNEIPESETLSISQRSSSVKTLRQKLEEIEKMDSLEDTLDSKPESKITKSSEVKTEATGIKTGDVKVSVNSQQTSAEKPAASTEVPSVPEDKKELSAQSKGMTVGVTGPMTMTEHQQISADRLAKLDVPDDELDQLVEINYKQLSSHKKKKHQEIKSGDQASANQKQDKPQLANHEAAKTSVVSSQPQGISVFQKTSVARLEQEKTVPKLVSDSDKLVPATEKILLEKEQSQRVIKQTEGVCSVEQKLETPKTLHRKEDVSIATKQLESTADIQKTTTNIGDSGDKAVSSVTKQPHTEVREKKFESTQALPVQVKSKDDAVDNTKYSTIVTDVQTVVKVSATDNVVSQSSAAKPDVKPQISSQSKDSPSVQTSDKQEDKASIEGTASGDQDVSTTDTETTTEDELSKLSVSEKLQLFKRLDKTARLSMDSEVKQHRRFAERKKKLARSQTLPVTGDEVTGAREVNSGEKRDIAKSETNLEKDGETILDTPTSPDTGQGVRRGSAMTQDEEKITGKPMVTGALTEQQQEDLASRQEKTEEENEEDHLSKLSLAEKVRLFSEKKEESPQKREAAIIRRKNRRLQSRFKTQSTDEPITSDEVEKARISPLAAALVKPPDPEILQSMSIRDQRELRAQWAEAALYDSGSRSGSRPGSRPSSMILDEGKAGEDAQRTAADDDSAGDDKKRKGILKTSESHIPEVRGILKHSPPSSDREVRSILKTEGTSSDGELDRKPASILKHDMSHHDTEPTDHPSILKKDSPQHEAKPESHGILKRDSSIQMKSSASESKHSILKKDSPPHDAQHEIRGILKKDSFEAKAEPEKGVLKKRDSGGGVSELGMDSMESGIFVKKDVNSNNAVLDEGDVVLKHVELVPDKGVLKKSSSMEVHMEQPTPSKSTLVIRTESRTMALGEEQTAVAADQVKPRGRVKSDPDMPATGGSQELGSSVGAGLSRSHSARVPGRRDSSTDDDSATSSEKMTWIKNDAIARRRLRKMEEKGSSTARHSMTAELEQKLLNKSLLAKDAVNDREEEPTHKPLEKSRSSPEKTDILDDPVVVRLRDNKLNKPRPRSIADRLSMLKDSQEGWRTKVEEKDVTKFTVEGKLNMAGLSPKPESPFLAKTRLPGTPGKFPLKRDSPETSPKITNGTELSFVRSPGLPIPQSAHALNKNESRGAQRPVVPPSAISPPLSLSPCSPPQSSPNLLMKLSDSSSESETDSDQPKKVKVIKPDDEGFKQFFEASAADHLTKEKVEVSLQDLDHLTAEADNRLSTVKKIRPQRRAAGSRNPLKALAARNDLQEEYEEVRSDVAERELRRIKREQITGTVHIAQEALAGLASKENFSKVHLRKTDSFGSSTPGSANLPYKDVMLIQVKGRRHCQVRLVAPTAHSINSGDCFLLVTGDSVYIWQGEFSNVIERSRATELATTVYQKRDLGCKTNREPVVITEGKQTMTTSGQKFWEILGGFADYQPPGPAEEDELYEMYMAETTKIYGLKGDQLILLDSGYLPTYDLLNSKKVLVFDFGSEMYTWMGKHVSFNDRKKALHLAKQIWNKGYNYIDCNINPLSPLTVEESGGLPLQSDTRPDWALFGKVTENMETVLFREKFVDWPDASKVIKVKGHDEEQESEEAAELVPYDVTKMLPLDTKPVTMVLEGSNVGRGKSWTEIDDGIQRGYEILTLGVEMFHILEYDHLKLDPESLGQFHNSDTYVIRWHLMISQSGLRNIRTQEMRHSVTGRERWAYFFWQGQYSTITEKGASALMTVELDEERGPQIRVTQGKEPPCFLQLFKGRMIIHKGKREDESTNTSGLWRLYIVLGEYPDECHLLEVPCKMSSLRSRASMILLNVKTGILHVWHGSKSATHTRQRAVSIGKALEKSCPPEVGLHKNVEVIMCEVSEGAEKSDFLVALDTRERTYHCLMKDPTPQRHSARLFYMHSVCGEFVATEILNPSRNHENLCTPFPFHQEELYKASQPALFLMDNHHEVYLWQGWWPEETEESDNIITGSSLSRFNVDRRLAIETTLNYCKEKNPDSPPKAWLVYAGLEPVRFTNLFPVWEVNEEARASNTKEGKTEGEMTSLDKLLKKLTCTQYTFAELQVRPLPEGVDPLKIESYLVDSEFQDIIKMTKEEFYALPSWKQNNIKKEVGLF